jgi:hypothetical protein
VEGQLPSHTIQWLAGRLSTNGCTNLATVSFLSHTVGLGVQTHTQVQCVSWEALWTGTYVRSSSAFPGRANLFAILPCLRDARAFLLHWTTHTLVCVPSQPFVLTHTSVDSRVVVYRPRENPSTPRSWERFTAVHESSSSTSNSSHAPLLASVSVLSHSLWPPPSLPARAQSETYTRPDLIPLLPAAVVVHVGSSPKLLARTSASPASLEDLPRTLLYNGPTTTSTHPDRYTWTTQYLPRLLYLPDTFYR